MSGLDVIDGPELTRKLWTEEILSKSSLRPVYLSTVEVNGGETFSSEFFKKLLNPLIENSDYTLNELIDKIDDSREKLSKTEVFKTIDVTLHSDFSKKVPEDVKRYNKEISIPTKVVFDLSTINMNIGEGFLNFNNEDHLNVDLNYLNNNFNNNAEFVNVGVNYNPYKPNDHLFTNGKFLANLNNPCFKFLIDIHHSQQNNETWQQASEGTTGGVIGLQYSKGKSLNVLTGLSLIKRTIHNIDDGADDQIKIFAGEYLKSSIINKIDYCKNIQFSDQLTKNFIINGFKSSAFYELASNQEQDDSTNLGLFAKACYSIDLYKSFFNNYLTTQLSTNFGGIYNFNEKFPIHVSDKFYLGGMNSFKGFKRNAIDSNGGLQFYKISATIYSKLPKFIISPNPEIESSCQVSYEPHPLRLYLNGTIGNVSNNLILEKTIPASAGFGIKYFNHWCNFDIGYFVSQRLHNSSNTFGIKDGLQFEVSIGGTNRTFN